MNNIEFDTLVCQFVKLFAEYEYKIKDSGYFKSGRHNIVQIKWDDFVEERVLLDDQEKEYIKSLYIVNHPPMQQVAINNELQWENVSADEKSAVVLFKHIRRVRNNLYHGGKFNDSWEHSRERNRNLIADAINVLRKYKHFLNEQSPV